MNKIILTGLFMAALILPAEAKAKKQDRVAPSQTTALDPVPVVGTVVGSTVEFVRKPALDRIVPLAGYYACSPFELIGARCR